MIKTLMKNIFIPLLTRIKALEYSIGLIADYVVEQGASGKWTYEKWASGKAVCRCRASGTIECTAQWGALYTTGNNTVSETYPTNFFIDVPNIQYSFETTGYNYWAIAGTSGGTKDHTPVLQLARPTASTIIYMANWEATGRWK